MRKSLIIALVALISSVVVPAAQAEPTLGERILAQEKAKKVIVQPAAPTAVEQILAQERGRQRDAGLFGPSPSSPVLVVGAADSFDVRDAGVGSAATLALALLVAAGIALRGTRRHATAPGS